MGKSYWPGAVTAQGEKLQTNEAVDSEQQCFELFDIWEKESGGALREAFYDYDGTMVFCKKDWVVQNRIVKGMLYPDDADIHAMIGDLIREGRVHMDDSLPSPYVYGIAKQMDVFLSANGFGFLTAVEDHRDVRAGIDIAVKIHSNAVNDPTAIIRRLESDGKASVEGQSVQTVCKCLQKINRCLKFLDADWRAGAVYLLKNGKRVPSEIVRKSNGRKKRHTRIRSDIASMAEEIMLNGSVSLEGYSRATCFRRTQEIREYLLSNGISQKIKVTAYRQDGTYAPFEIAKDCTETQRRGRPKTNPFSRATFAAEKLLSGEDIPLDGRSRATAYRLQKGINEYLSANGFSGRAKLHSYKKDGVYLPREIVMADRTGKK